MGRRVVRSIHLNGRLKVCVTNAATSTTARRVSVVRLVFPNDRHIADGGHRDR